VLTVSTEKLLNEDLGLVSIAIATLHWLYLRFAPVSCDLDLLRNRTISWAAVLDLLSLYFGA